MDIAPSGLGTRLNLDRSNPEETVFEYKVELQGALYEQDRVRLLDVAEKYPVRHIFSKCVRFQSG